MASITKFPLPLLQILPIWLPVAKYSKVHLKMDRSLVYLLANKVDAIMRQTW